MGRYTGPKDRLSRRFGKDIFGRNKPGLARRLKQAPGQHGTSRRQPSSYGVQLMEKQKVKKMYGLRERQFKRFYRSAREIAIKNPEITTGYALLRLLEQRLDNVVYRLGLAVTRPQARQFVSTGRILVDGKVVDRPSYLIKPGQTVALQPKYFSAPFMQEILSKATILPTWLEVQGQEGHVVRFPTRDEMDQDIDENLIVAFYSR